LTGAKAFPTTLLSILLVCSPLLAQTTSGRTEEIARLNALLEETSGLAWHEGSFWTHNDSGDSARIFRLDGRGRIEHQAKISNAEHVDWESMAQDADYLYLADTGNNFNLRGTLQIYRVAWADLAADTARADLITLTYDDHQGGRPRSHNFDAEALAVHGDQLWLFSKNRGDRQTKLYAFPKIPGNYRPAPLQTLPVDALVTGADIDPSSGELVLVGTRDFEASFVWWGPTGSEGVDWAAMTSMEILPDDQWESVLWDREQFGRLVLTHERNRRSYAGLAGVVLPR